MSKVLKDVAACKAALVETRHESDGTISGFSATGFLGGLRKYSACLAPGLLDLSRCHLRRLKEIDLKTEMVRPDK